MMKYKYTYLLYLQPTARQLAARLVSYYIIVVIVPVVDFIHSYF